MLTSSSSSHGQPNKLSEDAKQREVSLPSNQQEVPPSIYFGGCAFGAGFYVGVYAAMVDKWGKDFCQRTLLSGGSAGAVFALGMALGKTPQYMNDLYRTVSEKCEKYGTIYKCSVFLEEELRILLEDPMSYKLIEGKCGFGTTAFFSVHRWHLSWHDNEDLLDCIQGSCHIPLYCRKVDRIQGIEIVDGAYGFSGENLPHGDETLYVGIDPHAEITRDFTNAEMCFPSVGEDFDRMVESGYKAFMQWNGVKNKKVGKRLPNYQALVVLWTLKLLELVLYWVIHTFRWVQYNVLKLLGM